MARKINPNNLPWFPFFAAAWDGSPDVLQMSMAERGFYINLLVANWLYGSLPTDPWKLSKLLHARYEVATRWLHKWNKLVVCVEHMCSEHVVAVLSPCSECVVPKLQDLSETLRKNGGAPGQMRVDEMREEEMSESTPEVQRAKPEPPAVSTPPSTGRNRRSAPGSKPSLRPHDISKKLVCSACNLEDRYCKCPGAPRPAQTPAASLPTTQENPHGYPPTFE